MKPDPMIRAMMLALMLSGCTVTLRGDEADTYTRAEADALAAAVQCRALARTMVQISRCEVRR